ncbi:MAG: hypothetical protein ABWZ98_15635 [Nakamurella sp.]
MTGHLLTASPLYITVTAVITIAAAARGVWSPCGLSMISAINPFSEKARGNRYWLTACWFVLGSTVGGLLLGGLTAVLAALAGLFAETGELLVVIGVVGALLALLSDSRLTSFQLPEHPRQVNEQWLGRYRRWAYAAGFGIQIGFGFATYIMTAAVYLAAILGALSGSVTMALAVGATFGVTRGLAVLLSSRAENPADLRRLHRRIDLFTTRSLQLVMVIEAGAAVLLAYLAAGSVAAAAVALLVLLFAGWYRNRAQHRDRVSLTS